MRVGVRQLAMTPVGGVCQGNKCVEAAVYFSGCGQRDTERNGYRPQFLGSAHNDRRDHERTRKVVDVVLIGGIGRIDGRCDVSEASGADETNHGGVRKIQTAGGGWYTHSNGCQ